jgi:hypothetical protein
MEKDDPALMNASFSTPMRSIPADGEPLVKSAYSREYSFLHARHLSLLKGAAIAPAVSRARGYRTVMTSAALAGYGFAEIQRRAPALLMPIHDAQGRIGAHRIRPDQPRANAHGRVIEYEDSAGPWPPFDAPPGCVSHLRDPGVPLYIVTRVLAADSGASNGLCCIALIADRWLQDETSRSSPRALADWERVALDGRLVRLVLDSGAAMDAPARRAFAELARLLPQRGAVVEEIRLEACLDRSSAGAQFGLDHFFAAGGNAAKLERLVRRERRGATGGGASTGGPTDEGSNAEARLLDELLSAAQAPANSVGAQRIGPGGALVYAVPLGDRLALVASDGAIRLRRTDDAGPTRGSFSLDGIRRFRAGDQVNLPDVLDRVKAALVSHISLAEAWQPELIAHWIAGTYLYVLFPFFGYLHITSPTKRSGKSLLLELLSQLCFNATRITADPTPALLFRDAERNCGVQLFDEIEALNGFPRSNSQALASILNVGFKRGGAVARVVDAKSNALHEFNVYAPRALAGLNQLSDTLADRSFRIELMRKRADDRRTRFKAQAEGLAALRDDLHIAALGHAQEVADLYRCAERFPFPPGLDDRLRDILEPLFAIAAAADLKNRSDARMRMMLEAAEALSAMRREFDDGDSVAIAALDALAGACADADRIALSAAGAVALFRRQEELRRVCDGEVAARWLLRRLGFRSAIHRRERFWSGERPFITTETARGYEIERHKLDDLLARYQGMRA